MPRVSRQQLEEFALSKPNEYLKIFANSDPIGIADQLRAGLELQAQQAEVEKPGLWDEFTSGVSAGVDNLQGSAYGIGAIGANLVGAEDTRDQLLEGYLRNEQEAQANGPSVTTYSDVDSIGSGARYLAGGLGQLVPSLGTGGVGGLVGGLLARKAAGAAASKAAKEMGERLAREGAEKATIDQLSDQAGAIAGKQVTQKAAGLGFGVGEGAPITGSVYGENAQDGNYDPTKAVAAGTASALVGRFVGDKLAGEVLGLGGKAGIGKTAGVIGATESGTEVVQTGIENVATGRPLSEGMIDAAILGGVAGGGLGGAARAIGGGNAYGGAEDQGDFLDQALKRATDERNFRADTVGLPAPGQAATDLRTQELIARAERAAAGASGDSPIVAPDTLDDVKGGAVSRAEERAARRQALREAEQVRRQAALAGVDPFNLGETTSIDTTDPERPVIETAQGLPEGEASDIARRRLDLAQQVDQDVAEFDAQLAQVSQQQAPSNEPQRPRQTAARLANGARLGVLRRIREAGGIDINEMPDITGEGLINRRTGARSRKAGGNYTTIFQKDGLGIDDLRVLLAEEGYFPSTESGDITGDAQAVRDILRAVVDGDSESFIPESIRGEYDQARLEEDMLDREAADLERATEQEQERAKLQVLAEDTLDEGTLEQLAKQFDDDDTYFLKLEEAIDAKRVEIESAENGQVDQGDARQSREDGRAAQEVRGIEQSGAGKAPGRLPGTSRDSPGLPGSDEDSPGEVRGVRGEVTSSQDSTPAPKYQRLNDGSLLVEGDQQTLAATFSGEYRNDLGATVIPARLAEKAELRIQDQAPSEFQKRKRAPMSQLSRDKDGTVTGRFDEAETLGVPRAEMPQIKSGDRSALVQFLRSRGIDYSAEQSIDPNSIKPTQAEYIPAKVSKARQFKGNNRAILISEDNRIIDGHHQWLAAAEKGEPIKVIRLKGKAEDLLSAVREFPSAEFDGKAPEAENQVRGQQEDQQANAPLRDDGDSANATDRQGAQRQRVEEVLRRAALQEKVAPPENVRIIPAPHRAKSMAKIVRNLFGRNVVFFDSDSYETPNGFVDSDDPNTLYINAKAEKPHQRVLMHELLHSLKQGNEPAYKALVAATKDYVRDDVKAEWNRTYFGAESSTVPDAEIVEEILADAMGDYGTTSEFWSKMSDRMEPSLFQKVVKVFSDMIQKVMSKLEAETDMGSRRYFKEMEGVHKALVEFADTARESDAVDAEGAGANFSRKVAAKPDESAEAQAKKEYAEVEQQNADLLKAHREEGKPLPAPNGEPSNLTEFQWIQTRTPSFKRWFGDWEVGGEQFAETTDDNGEPFVFVHSGNKGLTEVKGSIGEFGGIFALRGKSAGYREHDYSLFVSGRIADDDAIQQEADNSSDGLKSIIESELGAQLSDEQVDAAVEIAINQGFDANSEDVQAIFQTEDTAEIYTSMQRVRGAIAREAGYSGVEIDDEFSGGDNSVLILPGASVKSATDNKGTFSPDDKRITYSRRTASTDRFRRRAHAGPTETTSAPPTDFTEANRKLREQDGKLWDAAKNLWKQQFHVGGLLPESVRDLNIGRTAQIRGVSKEVVQALRNLDLAAKAEFGKKLDGLSDERLSQINDALAGKNVVLPKQTKQAVLAMRQYIDGQSREYISILQDQVRDKMTADGETDNTLIDKITSNLGVYVHRSYRAFDDPKWFKKLPDKTINEARMYLQKGYVAQGMSIKEARGAAEVALHEIVKTDTAYGDMESFIKESKLGAKDLSVLMRKKEIAPEIKALLGEYVDPRINFTKTAQKMGQLILNQKFLDNVKDVGVGSFLWDEKTKPPEATVQIAGEKSDVYAPLNGMWTTPEIAKAFKDSLGSEKIEGWYSYAVGANALVNYGKAQPLTATVYTPDGPRQMGALKVGDTICATDGTTSEVLGIFPQGKMPVIRVTFSDGSTADVTKEHLWSVIGPYGMKSRTGVFTTEELMGWSERYLRDSSVPMGLAQFRKRPAPVDPYVLGALLGDGCLRSSSVRISSPDKEVLAKVGEGLPDGHYISRPPSWAVCDYSIKSSQTRTPNLLKNELVELGVWGKLSYEKYIPDDYKLNDEETRWELLRGLFDTDGYVNKNDGQPMFCTSSPQLASDVRDVAESLGASVITRVYKVAGGRPAHMLKIRYHDGAQFFSLPRKKNACTPKKRPVKRMFRSFEYLPAQECQCILVSHPSHLYMTDRFVVTHNTVLNPTTAMRNIQSALFFTVANGHMNYAKANDAWEVVRAHFTKDGEKRKKSQEYIAELTKLGITSDGVHEGDFQAYLESSSWMAEKLGATKLFNEKSGTFKAVGKANEMAQAFYRFGDDFWKVIGFENEKAALIRAGFTEQDAKQEAARRIKNTYPTYSLAGKAIKFLAKFPVIGSFPTFSAEVVRTSYHIVRIASQDIKEGRRTGNKELEANGWRRAMGVITMASLFPMIQILSAAANGVDEEEQEAIRELAPPWSRNSNLLFAGRDEDGRIQYFDLSFLDPYGLFKRPFQALLRDQPVDEAFKSGASDFLGPFLGSDILIKSVVEAGMNQRWETGADVYKEGQELEGMINHVRKAAQPGFISASERWIAALKDEKKRSGSGEYDEREEAAALVGWRISKIEPKTAVFFRAYDFAKSISDARGILRNELSNPNQVDEGDIRSARETAERVHVEAYRSMIRIVNAARKSGMTNTELLDTLRLKGVPRKSAAALIRGEIPVLTLSKASETKARRVARSLQGREDFGQEISKRYQFARQLERDQQDNTQYAVR